MIKFVKSRKTGPSGFLFQTVQFRQFLEQKQDVSYTRRFEYPRRFEAWTRTKRYQGANMEEIQARSQSRNNQIVWFWIPEYLVFTEQIESK
jgi:hypothetical protein